MHNLRIGLLALVAICVLLNLVGCKTLAVSGEKKYKVDMANAIMNIKDEIEKNGEASDQRVTKLQKLMDQYAEEFSMKGSYKFATELLDSIRKAKEDPSKEFKNYQQALGSCNMVLDTLKTEIKD